MSEIYVLRVITGKEDLVAGLIEQNNSKIKKIYCPKNAIGENLMPGYIFVEVDEMDGDVYRPVMEAPFALNYLCPASGVVPLLAADAAMISGYTCTRLDKGVPVDIVKGPLAGLRGSLHSIKLPKITIEVDLYGETVHCSVHVKHILLPDIEETVFSENIGLQIAKKGG